MLSTGIFANRQNRLLIGLLFHQSNDHTLLLILGLFVGRRVTQATSCVSFASDNVYILCDEVRRKMLMFLSAVAVVDLLKLVLMLEIFSGLLAFALLRKDRRAFCEFSVTYFSKRRNKFHHNCRGFYVSKAIFKKVQKAFQLKAKGP